MRYASRQKGGVWTYSANTRTVLSKIYGEDLRWNCTRRRNLGHFYQDSAANRVWHRSGNTNVLLSVRKFHSPAFLSFRLWPRGLATEYSVRLTEVQSNYDTTSTGIMNYWICLPVPKYFWQTCNFHFIYRSQTAGFSALPKWLWLCGKHSRNIHAFLPWTIAGCNTRKNQHFPSKHTPPANGTKQCSWLRG